MESTLIDVRLVDCPDDIEPAIRKKAESRFAKELLRSFPGEDQMRQAYKLFMDASEGGLISKSEEKIATTWTKAFEKARMAGFRDIAVEEAYFDVRLH